MTTGEKTMTRESHDLGVNPRGKRHAFNIGKRPLKSRYRVERSPRDSDFAPADPTLAFRSKFAFTFPPD